MRSVGISGSVRLVVQEDVLSAAEAELENVLFFQFDVTARFDDLVVEIGPVGGALEERNEMLHTRLSLRHQPSAARVLPAAPVRQFHSNL